jgi:DNA-directed RNA polymerase specialized sigma24 family protein
MPMNQTEIDRFNASLKDALPSLRVYALSLTRDRDRADNLVQQKSLVLVFGATAAPSGSREGRNGTTNWSSRISA